MFCRGLAYLSHPIHHSGTGIRDRLAELSAESPEERSLSSPSGKRRLSEEPRSSASSSSQMSPESHF